LKHTIDPMVDCVAKALLGDAEHTERTVDFLQAVLQASPPIVQVTIENPFTLKEFTEDHFVVVDVRARDEAGHVYVIEIQLQTPPYLPQRMIYSCADLFTHQLDQGQSYRALKPVVAIWLLGREMLAESEHWHHAFRLFDPKRSVGLSEHFVIHTLELPKWRRPCEGPLDAVDRWMYFFKEAKEWTALPPDLDDQVMRQAMQVLERFSEKEDNYRLYQARQNYHRAKLADEQLYQEALAELEQERAAKEQERAAKEQALQRADQDRAAKEQERAAKEQERAAKEQALQRADQDRAARERAEAEIARLREQLSKAGLDPT
jgi:predicted transposase/invertase (TIGR01784 family)